MKTPEEIQQEAEEALKRGENFYEKNEYDQAIKEYAEAIKLDLNCSLVYFNSVIPNKLPLEVLGDVAVSIAAMDNIKPELICEIERVLEEKLFTMSDENYDDYEAYTEIDDKE